MPESSFVAWRTRVDAALEHALPSADASPQRLHAAMRHAALDGGKRMRPLLVYATGTAFGADASALDTPAAVNVPDGNVFASSVGGMRMRGRPPEFADAVEIGLSAVERDSRAGQVAGAVAGQHRDCAPDVRIGIARTTQWYAPEKIPRLVGICRHPSVHRRGQCGAMLSTRMRSAPHSEAAARVSTRIACLTAP